MGVQAAHQMPYCQRDVVEEESLGEMKQKGGQRGSEHEKD